MPSFMRRILERFQTQKSYYQQCHMSERSFLRHFQKATRLTPSRYLQKLRIQKACEQLEQTKRSFESIAIDVGYEDPSACRKVFVRILQLTPKQFRQRFVK